MVNDKVEDSKRLVENSVLQEKIRNAKVFCFDVDSTVIKEEGIDVLAEFCGKGEDVTNLTKQAMEGSESYRSSLQKRLDILKPSLNQIKNCIREKGFQLTPGIKDLIDLLQSQGKHIYLISGGFELLIAPIAEKLNIQSKHVYANKILFNENNEYMGFDTDAPTSETGGKTIVIKKIKEELNNPTTIMIGDGITDLETKFDISKNILVEGGADIFIGFGGNQKRDKVLQHADVFLQDFQELINLLSQ